MPKAKFTLPIEEQIKQAVLAWDKPVSTEAIAEHLGFTLGCYRRDLEGAFDKTVVQDERKHNALQATRGLWMIKDTLNILWKTGIIDYADRTELIEQLCDERKAKEEEANAKEP